MLSFSARLSPSNFIASAIKRFSWELKKIFSCSADTQAHCVIERRDILVSFDLDFAGLPLRLIEVTVPSVTVFDAIF
jgi:hypothetical protein